MQQQTHYDRLGVTRNAPKEVIIAVYRAWMHALKAHPDLGGDEEVAKLINAAYEVLSDAEKRTAYDSSLDDKSLAEEPKRRAPRTVVDSPIAYCSGESGAWVKATAIDVSALGLRFRTVEELAIGEHIAIAFPGRAGPALEAVVRWCRANGADGSTAYEGGVEFFQPVPEIVGWFSRQGR
jgi:curved DNA-binding protein CbpA